MGTLHQLKRMVTDSLTNLVNGLGTAKDPRTAWMYEFMPLTRDQLEAAYRSDWIARRVVTAPAEDATREWREWQTDQDNIEAIENEEKRLDLRRQVKRALVKARLYGGSAIVMGVANQGLSDEEMDPERVKKGDLKFVAVFHHYELTPGRLIRDINSPWFNKPEYFTLASDVENINDAQKVGVGVRIHPSRVILFSGNELPDVNVLAGASNVWGDSVLQVVDEAIKATGVVIGGIAGMIADAKMDVINVPNLTAQLSNEAASTALINRFTLANQMKSSVNTLLLDEKEEWKRIQTSFNALPQLLQEYMSVAAGAAGIPVSRLIGGAKGKGLSGSEGGGETDIRNYYDGVSNEQRNEISPTLTPLDNVLLASTFGSIDESIYYEWTPLWQLSDAEKADIAQKKSATVQADVTMALINPDVLRKSRINQLIEDGFYPGIEDAIDEFGAEPEEPEIDEDMINEHLGMMQKSAGQLQSIGKAAGLDKPPAIGDGFNPDQPRDEDGKWSSADTDVLVGDKTITNLKGQKIKAPRTFYRGDNDGDTRRISTGKADWDKHLFAADNIDAASYYGKTITRIDAKPGAKILYEGTKEFVSLAKGLKGNLLEISNAVAQRSVGKYDAVWFKRQGDVGTVILNRDAFIIRGSKRTKIKDAAPRTLYVCRKVLNADAILRWARKQGIETDITADDMHVTITYSRAKVDWMKMGDNYPSSSNDRLEVGAGGPRMLDLFGPAKDTLVLLFNDWQLKHRHNEMVREGASWDWPEYQPHITLKTNGANAVDPHKIEPYRGPIVLGPEIFEEVKE